MKFNLWFEDELEEENVDVGALLRWLGELRFNYDVVVEVRLSQYHAEDE